MNQQTLNLRDIHLPEPISWWPIAPGWWILLCGTLLIITVLFIGRKIYKSRQLGRDIRAEFETIKQQFQDTQNKSQLARSLSTLLRRANISYYPQANIAGLTGESWLSHLDKTNTRPFVKASFNSETGKVLLSAPYLPDETTLDFDARTLIGLCESWLTSTHTETQVARP
jgi:hypothetical protein